MTKKPAGERPAPARRAPVKKAAQAKPTEKQGAKAPAAAKKPGRVDWEAVERDYRTGRFTNVELCSKHRLDPATLSRKIKGDRAKNAAAWHKDLTEVVRQATNARLMAETVKAEIKDGQEQVKSAIQAAAEVNAQVILRHRTQVRSAVDVAMRMLAELDATTQNQDEIEGLFEKITEDISGPALSAAQQQFRDFMRLHSRVGSVQKLMTALKDAQALEAQAFGNLYDPKNRVGGYENLSDDEIDAEIERLQSARPTTA